MKLEPMIMLHVDLFGVVVGATEKIGDPAAVQRTIYDIVQINPSISKVKVYLKTDPNSLSFHSVWSVRRDDSGGFSDLVELPAAVPSPSSALSCTE